MEPQLYSSSDPSAISAILERSLTRSGESIVDLSAASPVLLVFLRHSGCTFCREALGDIARSRLAIEQGGTRIVLVHMGDTEALEKLLLRNGLSRLDRICDQSQELYGAFGLKRGNFKQIFGPKVLWRAFLAGVVVRHGLGSILADASQMPGIFLIHHSAIVTRFRHRSAADRPDYLELCVRDSLPAK